MYTYFLGWKSGNNICRTRNARTMLPAFGSSTSVRLGHVNNDDLALINTRSLCYTACTDTLATQTFNCCEFQLYRGQAYCIGMNGPLFAVAPTTSGGYNYSIWAMSMPFRKSILFLSYFSKQYLSYSKVHPKWSKLFGHSAKTLCHS